MKPRPMQFSAYSCKMTKPALCVSGRFSGVLLLLLPVTGLSRPEAVSAVRVMKHYGKYPEATSVMSEERTLAFHAIHRTSDFRKEKSTSLR